MNKQELIDYLKQQKIGKVKFAFADVDGVLRGKTISIDKFLGGLESGYGFCDVVFGWDSHDELYPEAEITGWHTGFPDKICHIDINTFRQIPWQDNLPFFLADFGQSGVYSCPRSLLRKVVQECQSMGYQTLFSQEFEWFNFLETPASLQDKQFKNLTTLSPGMFGYSILRPSLNQKYNNDLFDSLYDFGVELEGLHTETGPGVYEAAISKDQALAAADKAVLFKMAVKEIAYQHGILASFMAKWNAELPGCSGHIHQSLWNEDLSRNLFYEETDSHRMSELMKQYIAGQLYCLPYILPMFAPTVNSYKRLVEGAWAPTTLTWGIDNRTTALRVINSSGSDARLETRVPGSDSNPYLAIAAALAAGLYGIKQGMKLETPLTQGNGYKNDSAQKLPTNLYEASVAMKNSEIARQLFGEEFVTHFCDTRLWEWKQFSKQVSDWELKRYFEII